MKEILSYLYFRVPGVFSRGPLERSWIFTKTNLPQKECPQTNHNHPFFIATVFIFCSNHSWFLLFQSHKVNARLIFVRHHIWSGSFHVDHVHLCHARRRKFGWKVGFQNLILSHQKSEITWDFGLWVAIYFQAISRGDTVQTLFITSDSIQVSSHDLFIPDCWVVTKGCLACFQKRFSSHLRNSRVKCNKTTSPKMNECPKKKPFQKEITS